MRKVLKKLRDLLKKLIGAKAWVYISLFYYGYLFRYFTAETHEIVKSIVTLAIASIICWIDWQAQQEHEEEAKLDSYLEGYKTGYKVGSAK